MPASRDDAKGYSGGRAIWDPRVGNLSAGSEASRRAGPGFARRTMPILLRMLVLMALFGALAWLLGHSRTVLVLAAFATANVALAVAWPSAFLWHAGLWEKLGRAGGRAVGTVLLAIAYYLVFTPANLALRLLGRRALPLEFPGRASTYWRDVHERPRSESDYRRQF